MGTGHRRTGAGNDDQFQSSRWPIAISNDNGDSSKGLVRGHGNLQGVSVDCDEALKRVCGNADDSVAGRDCRVREETC